MTTDEPQYRLIANILRHAIRSGTLKPGQHIPSCSTLTARHRVGRATITKAVAVLRTEGLIEDRAGKGIFVKPHHTKDGLGDRIAARFADLDARQWGYDHGFAGHYGEDAETDSFVDAALDILTTVTADLRHRHQQLFDHHRTLLDNLADAVHLPASTPVDELLAEVGRRFKGLIRAMPGHGLDHGTIGGHRTCECGLVVDTNMKIWFDHQADLRRDASAVITEDMGTLLQNAAPDMSWVDRLPTVADIRERVRQLTPEQRTAILEDVRRIEKAITYDQ